MQVKPPDEHLMGRLVAVFGESPKTRHELGIQLRRALGQVDRHVIDEAVGRCEGADRKPRSVRFFATTLERTAAHYGIELLADG